MSKVVYAPKRIKDYYECFRKSKLIGLSIKFLRSLPFITLFIRKQRGMTASGGTLGFNIC